MSLMRVVAGTVLPYDAPQPVQGVVPPGTEIQQHRLALHARALHIRAGPEDGPIQHRAVDDRL